MATIRTMTPADYPMVATIACDAANRALVGRPVWETPADVAAELTALERCAFIVAEEEDGRIVGLAGYSLTESGEALIYGPLVAVEGHGIGAWLASRIEAMARQQGAHACAMLIGLQNRSGAAWAEWRGYQRDSESPELIAMWLAPGELLLPAAARSGEVVRRAGTGDLARIASLYQACFPTGALTPDDWATRLGECWVLESAGAVQALFRLAEAPARVEDLCVEPALRRQGLAARLLTGALEQFWAGQPVKVGVSVRQESTAAAALFRQLGFRREIPAARWVKREG